MDNLTRTIQSAIQSNDYAALSDVFSSDYGPSSWQNVGQGEQRSLASDLIHHAVSNEEFLTNAVQSPDMMYVFTTALGHLPATVPQAADNTLRQKLFQVKVAEEDYAGAARILAGMRMEDDEKSLYYVKPADKADVYVKIAECFLAQDEIAESDSAVNKAGTAVEAIPNKEQHTALLLRYKSTTARVLDANRKFLQASQRYLELSQSATDLIDADELLQMLGRAVTCAILAPSGPQRQRVLGHLARDHRLSQLDRLTEFCTHATIVRKMYRQQLLQPAELTQLEASLMPHQKAIMGDGLTILERGVVEHNMIAVSNTYHSIYVKDLALILGVNERRAEKIAASMILEGSLHGAMDQVEGLLEFESEEPPPVQWDRSLTTFCAELNRVTESIKTATTTA
jgi:COP9 signalosome complex subunit 4